MDQRLEKSVNMLKIEKAKHNVLDSPANALINSATLRFGSKLKTSCNFDENKDINTGRS